MNFAKIKLPIFTGTSTRRRLKGDKPPINQRLDDEILLDNTGTTFYFGPQSIEQRSFGGATESLETSGPIFVVPRKLVPNSTFQRKASLQLSSLPDEIVDLTQEVSDHGPFSSQSSNHSRDQRSSAVKTDADLHLLEWLRAALERVGKKKRRREETL